MITRLKRKFRNLNSDQRFSEILTGSIWTLSARVVATGLGLVTSVVIGRIYGADMLGIVALLQASLMFASIVTIMGMNSSVLRLIPEHIAKYSAKSAFNVYRKMAYLVVTTSIIFGVILYFAADTIATYVFKKPQLSYLVSTTAGVLLFYSLMELNTQTIRALRLKKAFAFMQVFPSAAMLISLGAIMIFHGSPSAPVYAQITAWTAASLMGAVIVIRVFQMQMKRSDDIGLMTGRSILQISSPMLITTSMQFVIGQTGVILLGIFGTASDVGYYSVAVKLATLSTFILQAINSMAAPKFSELYHKGEIEELFYVARKSTRLMFWTSIPVILILLIFGELIVSVLFGSEFAVAYPALALLVIGQAIHSMSGSTGIFMNMTGNQNVLRNIMVVAGVLNIGIGLILIPRFGIVGAASAGMLCLAFWNIYTLVYIRRKYGQSIGYFPILFK